MNLYLDLDGVLVDFVGGVCKVFGISKEELYRRWEPNNWKIHEGLEMTESDLWQTIDTVPHFWEQLEWTEDGKQILHLCERYLDPDDDELVLMTSPSRDPKSAAGKIEWIYQHAPKYRRKFAITPVKTGFASLQSVLVDDSDRNIREFMLALGWTVLIPRRWNSNYNIRNSTLKFLEESLLNLGYRPHDDLR